MIKFGPAGRDKKYIEEGYKNILNSPEWIKNFGLDLYEISFGHGIVINENYAKKLYEKAKENQIEISIHAPYYINFANPNEELVEKSINYVLNSLKILKILGGRCLVIHSGTQLKLDRQTAFNNVLERYKLLIKKIYEENLNDMYICPETMGKHSQIGSVDEIIEICKLDKIVLPTFDFGHINAITNGGLKSKEDYNKIISKCFKELGEEKTKNMHIHFSNIEYGTKGEIRHLTFEDKIYGPNYKDMIDALIENDISASVICESNGTMATDAKIMKDYYLEKINNTVNYTNIQKDDIFVYDKIYYCKNIQKLSIKNELKYIFSLYEYDNNLEIQKSFSMGDKLKKINLKKEKILFKGIEEDYAYFVFNNEEYKISVNLIKNSLDFIKINSICYGYFANGKLLNVKSLDIVELKVVKIERKKSSWDIFNSKNVYLETGVLLNVPLSVNKNDTIKIDTKSNKYISKIEE